MANEAEKRDWLLRVLGFDVSRNAGSGKQGGYLGIWRDAKEGVDAAIDALAARLRAFGDPDLERIAEFGLYGLTDGETVALTAALREAEADPAGARDKLADAIDAYRAALDDNDAITLIDRNPFGVQVSMRATLGRALAQLEQKLAA